MYSCVTFDCAFNIKRAGVFLTEESWLVSSMSYDPEAIEVILSSAIDAVGANAPDKILTKEIVGNLPVTGSLQNR